MPKIHLLLKKEDINKVKMQNEKIAVVFDVLLATSTITSALYFGAHEVIPVLNDEEAKNKATEFSEQDCVLVGEYEGKTIEGFLDPNPLDLKEKVAGKTVILSTTNGTVAIRKASEAKQVLICSLLNGKAVAKEILSSHRDETIIIICSGSSGEFCLEDFYGAGYLLHCLTSGDETEWELTDSAKAALSFYLGTSESSAEVLLQSRIGQLLMKNGFTEEMQFISQKDLVQIIPIFKDGKIKSLEGRVSEKNAYKA